MGDILYRETLVSAGIFKNTQIQITLYADHLEMESSKPMSSKELWEVQRHITYEKKEILYYDKVTHYERTERPVPVSNGITFYEFLFQGDFEVEKAGKRKGTTVISVMTMDKQLWDALDSYTPLIPSVEKKFADTEALQRAAADPSVAKGTVEIIVGKRMNKTFRLFVNDIVWQNYTYPPVRTELPLGTYRIKISRGVPNMDDGTTDNTYSNEVTVTLDETTPIIHLEAKEGFFSPSLKIVS